MHWLWEFRQRSLDILKQVKPLNITNQSNTFETIEKLLGNKGQFIKIYFVISLLNLKLVQIIGVKSEGNIN